MGFTMASADERRVLDLTAVPWQDFHRMRQDAVKHADDYEFQRFVGPVHDTLLADMTTLLNGMNDAPLGDLDLRHEHLDTVRVRELEDVNERFGLITYTTIARHKDTGEPAGYSRIFLDATSPEPWARQGDTVVLRKHRGHRLGLLLKLAQAQWFHSSEPYVEKIITWNEVSNKHMIAINERLGFTVLDRWNHVQLRLR
ncbi:hypothetical protein [Rhizohabitans arisaemae]|uniref:hypothetical protein n=1 Tax=Rhizohabitans arisaemae TaxID=2720610 RepID=UPI003D161731